MLLVGCAVGLRERYRVRRAQAAALACETRTEMCVCSDEVRPAVSGRPIRWSINRYSYRGCTTLSREERYLFL